MGVLTSGRGSLFSLTGGAALTADGLGALAGKNKDDHFKATKGTAKAMAGAAAIKRRDWRNCRGRRRNCQSRTSSRCSRADDYQARERSDKDNQ